jgi:hypothetical protein
MANCNSVKIKYVFLDIYGTVLCSDDHENIMPPRTGIENFFDHCNSINVPIIATSDADIESLLFDLKDCFEKFPQRKMNTNRFNAFEKMEKEGYKKFMPLIEKYRVAPENVLVIGDNQLADIYGAEIIGANRLLVPRYLTTRPEEFDFGNIKLR